MKITAPTSDAHTSCNGIILLQVVAGAVVARALVASPLAGVGQAPCHLSSGNIVKTKQQERSISRTYNQLLF